jgi:hypothetical protein
MPKFLAMWNMPGCLPEMEPQEFSSFDEAKQFIVDELNSIDYSGHYVPFSPEDCAYTIMRNLFLKADKSCVSSVLPNGYVYSIKETD